MSGLTRAGCLAAPIEPAFVRRARRLVWGGCAASAESPLTTGLDLNWPEAVDYRSGRAMPLARSTVPKPKPAVGQNGAGVGRRWMSSTNAHAARGRNEAFRPLRLCRPADAVGARLAALIDVSGDALWLSLITLTAASSGLRRSSCHDLTWTFACAEQHALHRHHAKPRLDRRECRFIAAFKDSRCLAA